MKVAVALIIDKNQRVLITQRGMHVPHPGVWEFPGGKIEPFESPSAALIREIKEEVGLDVLTHHLIGEITHTYEHQSVSLIVFHVSGFRGEPSMLEGQMDLRWVLQAELKDFEFPAANERIMVLIESTGILSK